MEKGRDSAPNAYATLGDPRTVTLLLSIVTGTRSHVSCVDLTVPAARPTVQRMAPPEDRLLAVERTPLAIRALRDEGIIAAATPWKRPPP